jgi:hypothetical protein
MVAIEVQLKSPGDFHRSPSLEKRGKGRFFSEAAGLPSKRNPPQSPFAKGGDNSTRANPTSRIYFERAPASSIPLQRENFHLVVASLTGNESREIFGWSNRNGLTENFFYAEQ